MTITIKGVPAQYSEKELQVRQQAAIKAYKETTQSLYRLRANNTIDLFKKYEELVKKGYCFAGHPPETDLHNRVWMKKPKHLQDEDLSIIKNKVKLSYRAELELERIEYEDLLVLQMLEADGVKEAKAREAKAAKRLAEIKLLAANTYTPLEFPVEGNLHL